MSLSRVQVLREVLLGPDEGVIDSHRELLTIILSIRSHPSGCLTVCRPVERPARGRTMTATTAAKVGSNNSSSRRAGVRRHFHMSGRLVTASV